MEIQTQPDLLNSSEASYWSWNDLDVSWSKTSSPNELSPAILLIHGFGACKEHWRHNQSVISAATDCYAIDLIGFGESSQPKARLKGEAYNPEAFCYCFDSWAEQISAFCKEVIKKPVLLIGNSIGGVIALRAAQNLQDECKGIVLIDCAQRTMDDKRLKEQPSWMQWFRPMLKTLVQQRWLSESLFRNAAHPSVIKKVLNQAYPSGNNLDIELINLLHYPSKRPGAAEAFRGFINLFNDHLAPELMAGLTQDVHLIWGESDPWEPVELAKEWACSIPCIKSLEIIKGAGHCPHDEIPEEVNKLLLRIIQQAK